jgi:Uma2 family endonuclease
MGMPAPQLEWTAERATAIPADGNRYEVLDGDLVVTPAPSWDHQWAVGALYRRLFDHAFTNRIGWLCQSPADIVFSPRRLVQPDLFVVPWGEVRPHDWAGVTSLLLAIEILSPSTAHADRHRKRMIYQDEGVPEYWIVDLDARLVERWRPDDARPEILATRLEWQPRAELEPLVVDLTAFFDEVLGPAPHDAR